MASYNLQPTVQNNVDYFNVTLNEAIIYLANHGWRFIPLYGKKPFLSDWPNVATNDIQTLNRWAELYRSCNWGTVLGSDRFVLDVDGDSGRATLEQLERDNGTLPPTFIVRSGREEPSFHYYFNYPSEFTVGNCKLGPGLEIKGNRGQCVFPPSIHPDTGNKYTFASCDPPATAPLWLLQRIQKAPTSTVASSHFDFPIPTQLERNTALKALREDAAQLAALVHGDNRNAALNRTAFSLATMIAPGWIDLTAVEAALLDASHKNGHTAKHGLPQTTATLQSGLRRGMQRPRDPLPLELEPHPGIQVTSQAPMPATSTQSNQQRRIEIVTLEDIRMENVKWFWKPFVPSGKFVLLVGKSGGGKSTLSLSLAATVSNSGKWPDGTECVEPGHVLIWTSEDAGKDTIGPRLFAMGADPKRVHIIKSTLDLKTGRTKPFNPATDISILRDEFGKNPNVRLIIIDPVVSMVEGEMNQANVTRAGLDVLPALAEEWNCCIIGITHFKKGSEGRDPMDRVIGSQAFHALPRVVLVVGKDTQSSRRVLGIAKNNIGSDEGGFEFTIQPATHFFETEVIETSKVVWGDSIDGNAAEIIESVEHFAKEERISKAQSSKLEHAKQFARGLLLPFGKSMLSVDFDAKAIEAGISVRTWKQAKLELAIKPKPETMGGAFMVKLPPNSPFNSSLLSTNSQQDPFKGY
jgi:energy-coupling factor transporter ATP-binding protein EcfA2